MSPPPPELIDFSDNFSGSTTTPLGLATVTRVARNTGQEFTFQPGFNPHQAVSESVNRLYTRDTAGMRNPDALDIRTAAQLYPRDGGNPMLFATTGASTLEFPARGDVFRKISVIHSGGPGIRLTIQGATMEETRWHEWEHPALTSFQFTRSGDNPGMVMKFGGDENGGLYFRDLESYGFQNCDTTNRNCNAPNTHDISIGFGANRHSPTEGALAYYWRALVPNHHLDRDGNVLVPGETIASQADPDTSYTVTDDVGTYTLELTHAATGLEDAADADADARYLSYAAYGLFNFFDKYSAPTGLDGAVERMQTISYGLDAFADTDNMRTTDLTEDITATFKGRTIAYLLHLEAGTESNRSVNALTRMRGDVQLTANVGPTNTITGTISGLEYYTSDTSQTWSWRNTDITTGANTQSFSFATAFGSATTVLNLTSGTIDADGSYAGTVTPSTGPDTYFDAGAFKGNLYGPLDGLETAGTWYIPAKKRPTNVGISGVIGSFGACQDDKGRC